MNGYLPFIKKQASYKEVTLFSTIKITILLIAITMISSLALIENAHAVKRCDRWIEAVPQCPDPLTPNATTPTPSPECLTDCSNLFTAKTQLSRQIDPLDVTINTNLATNLSTILTPATTIQSTCISECNGSTVTAPCNPTPPPGSTATTRTLTQAYCQGLYVNHGGNPLILSNLNACMHDCPTHLRAECENKCSTRENCKSTVCSLPTVTDSTQCNADCSTLSRCTAECTSNNPTCLGTCATTDLCKNHCTALYSTAGANRSRCNSMCLDVVAGTNSLTTSGSCNTYCQANYPDPDGSLIGSSATCSSYWYPAIKVGVEIAMGAICTDLEITADHDEVLQIDWNDPQFASRSAAYSRTTFGYSPADTQRYGYYAGILQDVTTGSARVCIFDGGFGHTWPSTWRGYNTDMMHGVTLGTTAWLDELNGRLSYLDASGNGELGCHPIPLPNGPPPCCRHLATAPATPSVQSLDFSASQPFVPDVSPSSQYSTFIQPRIRVIFAPSNSPTDLFVDLTWDYTTDLPGASNQGYGQGECQPMVDPQGNMRTFCVNMNDTHTQICAREQGGTHLGCVPRNLDMENITPSQRPLLSHASTSTHAIPAVTITFAGNNRSLSITGSRSNSCGIMFGQTFCATLRTDHPNYPSDQVIGIQGFFKVDPSPRSDAYIPNIYHEVVTLNNHRDGLAVLTPAAPCPLQSTLTTASGFTTWPETQSLYTLTDISRAAVIQPPCQIGYPHGCQQCPVGYRQSAAGAPYRRCLRLTNDRSQWEAVNNPCIENICPAGTTYTSTSAPGYQPHLDIYWPQTVSSKNFSTPTTVDAIAQSNTTPVCRNRNYKPQSSGAPQRTCDYNGSWAAPSAITRTCLQKGCPNISISTGANSAHAFATWPLGYAGNYYVASSCIGNRDSYTTNYRLFSHRTSISNSYRTISYNYGTRTNYSSARSVRLITGGGSHYNNMPLRHCSYDTSNPANLDGIWQPVTGECRSVCNATAASFTGGTWVRSRHGERRTISCSTWHPDQTGTISRTCNGSTWGTEDFNSCKRQAEAAIGLHSNESGSDWRIWWSRRKVSSNSNILTELPRNRCGSYSGDYGCPTFTNGLEYINIIKGTWEVCSGNNYTGSCQSLGPGNHSWPRPGGSPANSIRVIQWDP